MNSWRKCEVAPGTKKLRIGTVWSHFFVVRIAEEMRGKYVEGKASI